MVIEAQAGPVRVSNGWARKNRLSTQVAQRIREIIIEENLKPGQKLATESELAARLGVSRTVIREAVKTLEEWRAIRTVTGKGLYVAQMDTETVSEAFRLLLDQSESPLNALSEIRRMLEVEVAGLAAERATAGDLAALQRILQRMLQAYAAASSGQAPADAFIEADLEFHSALAVAAHNPLLPVMLEPVAGLLRQLRHVAASAPGALDEGMTSHRLILEQVEARSRTKARSAMREHLMHAETWVAMAQGQVTHG